jgi:hypothetical protein
MKSFFRYKILILILLYNFYFFVSLVNETTVYPGQPDSHQSIPVYVLAQGLPSDNSPLINENITPVFEVKQTQVKKEVIKSPVQCYVLKTYIQHNHLHFNIPLICYKFVVSQHTSDG